MKNTFAKTLEDLINVAGYAVSVEEQFIDKNNGVTLRGYIIHENGSSISPTIYYNEEKSENENLHGMFDAYIRERENGPKFLVKDIMEKGYVLNHLTFKLINKELNKDLLEDVPHVDFLDLAKVFVVDCTSEGDNNRATILLHNSHLKYLGITLEDLESHATSLWGFECKGILEYLAGLYGMPSPDEVDGPPMYIVTNEAKLFGAGLMAVPDALKRVSQITGLKEFTIIPSSIHEILVIDDSLPAEGVLEMVMDINANEVSPEEKLADSVYHYDGKKLSKVA